MMLINIKVNINKNPGEIHSVLYLAMQKIKNYGHWKKFSWVRICQCNEALYPVVDALNLF